MPPSSPQFTPAQVLAAGRRAEAEGKPDLAEHFYRHVVEHYGATPDAAVARDGLIRLGEKRAAHPLSAAVASSPEQTAQEQTAPDKTNAAHTGPPLAAGNGKLDPARLGGVARGSAASGDEAASDPAPALPDFPLPLDRSPPRKVARPRRRYRLGRLMTRLVGLAGWLMLIAGLALVPLAWTSKTEPWLPLPASPADLTITVKWAAVQAFGGLVLVLLALVARAVFDMAEEGAGPEE